MQHTVHSWSTPEHSTNTHIHTFCLVHTRAFNKHSHSHILFLLVFIRKTLLLFVFAFLSSRSVEMSSYWDDNYIFGQYSSENWGHESVPSGVPDSNEQEEVVSSIQEKQNNPFLDLNKHPPVDETAPVDDSYHASGYGGDGGYGGDHGYGGDGRYGGDGGFGGDGGYGGDRGYGGDGGYGGDSGYGGYGGYSGYGGYGRDGDHQQFISPGTPYVHQNNPDVGGYGGYGGYGRYGGEAPPILDNPYLKKQVFNSLDELKKRIQEIANADGFVIVTRRSMKIRGRTGRVWLECDRGGEHQSTATLRKAGSKKTGCPFYLLAVRNHPYETWEIKDGTIEHNHELCEDLWAHAFVRRFTPSVMKLIKQLTAQNMEPCKIFQTIRKQDPNRFHVQKDVQNIVAKIRAEQRQGLTPMQSLENVLINNDFIYETREEPGTEIVTEIFFLHRDSRVMWRAFPHVMLIDATYKTNIYNIAFIQIVGMTPTNKSFIIAHAVVSKERGDNFVWVLERVKSMLDECMEPRVILTDRDLALMGACAKVFPDASRLLCRWHIQQNVMKHYKGAFTDEDRKKFLSFWGTLIESPSIPIYEYHLRNMRKRLVQCKRSRVFKYVYDNWLKDYKEMFVFAWTDKRRNFGNRTTNRVESQHANLKRYVLDRSSLDRVVGCVRDIVETQFGEIRKTFRESIEKTMKHHKHPMFQHLLGKVSHLALDLLHGEAIRKLDVLERFHSSCGSKCGTAVGCPVLVG
ncbi:putative transcription factor FAR family [Helianthus annuus]|nr:putative transcription factor FAR family [Helianthus annuus]